MRHLLKSPVTSRWMAERLALEHVGPETEILGVAPLDQAGSGDLAFANRAVSGGDSGRILIRSESAGPESGSAVLAANPRLTFIRALLVLDREVGFERDRSEPRIDPTATLGSNVVVEAGVRIGPGSRIGHGVVLHTGTKIGRNCVIGGNTVVGGTGFGFERDDDGRPLPFLHLGGVVLADEVEIGAVTAIDRGTLGDTVIGGGSKIDNLVHIAHNAEIGEDCMIIAGAEISGGVRLGKRCWVGPNACVIDGVTLGDDVVVGIGAVVVKPVPAGQTVAGNPAEELGLLTRKRAAVKALLG
jgi:UDP-3-O-[3-hydroxymyristoyl] glucosamine N-acyltransferase